MVRYNFDLIGAYFSQFKKLVENFGFIQGCDSIYYPNKKSIGYKHLWSFTIQDNNGNKGSFSIGLQLNCQKENERSGYIEFNPNKLMRFNQFQSFFETFMQLCMHLTLVRYDCAIDIPLPRNKVKLVRSSKCSYEYQYHENVKDGLLLNSSVTEYQGSRNKNKFTKLYDKTKESSLDYDLTRIEFTFNRDELEFKNLPKFYVYDENVIKHSLDFTSLSNTQLVLVDLLRNSEDINYYLKSLDYRLRKKIEPYLNDATLNLDFDLIKSVRDLALYFEI